MAPAPAQEPLVLKLPHLDHSAGQPDFVLVGVSSEGRRPLDLKLIGTENETVFSVSLKHSQTSTLKDPKASISQEQWDTVLSYVLLGTVPDEEHTASIQGVEAVAKVTSRGKSLTVTIQRRIEGITPKLGTITLQEDDQDENQPDLFEWCASAVESKNKSIKELQALKLSLKEKDEQNKKLEESFAELVALKNGHEKSLLEKFSLLLNEKKLKIRDQQRLLASSNVDPAKLKALQEARRDSRSRSAGPSRKGKRKAGDNAQEDSDSDGGFEKMDVDVKEEPAQDSEDEDQARRTPDAESTADETEDEDEEPPPSLPMKKTVNSAVGAPNASQSSSGTAQNDAPQPNRGLPSRVSVPPPKPAPAGDGSETESDDDEL